MSTETRSPPSGASDWRPVLFAATASRPCLASAAIRPELAGVGGTSEVADRLVEALDRLDGVPRWLSENGQLTASVYVDAASRSLNLANEIIRLADGEAAEEEPGDEELDPRLLEWLI